MKRLLYLASLVFFSSALQAQSSNILLLQKKGKTIQNFIAGKYISLKTVQGNYADGAITRVGIDSLYIRHFDIQRSQTDYGAVFIDTAYRYTTVVSYKDIGAIIFAKKSTKKSSNGTILIIAGGGVMVLGAVNGLYRNEPPKDWYKTSSYITAGALIATGLLLKHTATKVYPVGKKYKLKILPLNSR